MTNYNDGKWHGWNGGECPVHPDSVVEYISAINGPVRRESHYGKTEASNVVWEGHDDWFISAFRVVKEYREPREFWIDKQDRQVLERDPKDSVYYIHVREVIE